MTDKERLEEIKSRVWKDKGTYAMGDYSQREGYIYTLSDYDYEWLVKQAERVKELEYAVRKIDVVIDHHRLIKRKEADELADCIVGIISDLEEKVGEIT